MKPSTVGCSIFSFFAASCLLLWAIGLKFRVFNIPTPNKAQTIYIWLITAFLYVVIALISLYYALSDDTDDQAALVLKREEARLAQKHRSIGGRKLAARVAREIVTRECGGVLSVALLEDEKEEEAERIRIKRQKQLQELLRKTTRA